ncbi:MAG: GNAT family N-acetyltransferase [Acidimicrobiia bacterium]
MGEPGISDASSLRRELGDGLVLRSARHEDGAELVDFNGAMHADDDLPASTLTDWTRDLFDVPHPTFRADRDVTVVEDTATGRIVSALFLIPQVWTYAGAAVKVGQPELVATHPDYRRRGLIRAQFDVIHDWSRAAGHVWQFISGIPWYYRQFGYGYALDLPPRPVLWLGATAPPPSTELALRAATEADIGILAAIEAEASSGTMLGPLRGTDGFALELARRPGSLAAREVLVVEPTAPGATPVGYVAHQRRLVDGVLSVHAFELRRGTSWLAPTAAVLAHLHDRVRHRDGPGRGVRFALPAAHPALRCAATRLGAGPPGTYGLYVRVPDVVALLRVIAPVLEARLADSPAIGWTGELRLGFYTGGLLIRFAEGRVASIEPWTPPSDDTASAADARLMVDDFLHLLLGNRIIGDLERTTADCLLASDAGALLLDVLFPPMPMSAWEFC